MKRVKISTEEAKSKEKQHDLKTKVTSKHGNLTLNEKAAIQKKIKSCKDESWVVKMKKGNNLRICCSTTVFEKIRRQINTTEYKPRAHRKWRWERASV